jgi:serine/threonine-protein kinase HipA
VARDVLALTLAGSKEFPDRKRLVAFARQHCSLAEAKANELLERVAHGVTQAIKDLRRYAKGHRDFQKAAVHFVKAFERGLERSVLKAK